MQLKNNRFRKKKQV